MPSLRRTASTSAVPRSSPYSLPLRGNAPHRRSSGSETSGRRVLADIDWWTVTEGQTADTAADDNQENDADETSNRALALQETSAIELSPLLLSTSIHIAYVEPTDVEPTPLPWIGTSEDASIPISQFSNLSLAPQTPTRATSDVDVSMPTSPALSTSSLDAPSSPESDGVRTPPMGSPIGSRVAEAISIDILDSSFETMLNSRRGHYASLSARRPAPSLRRSFTEPHIEYSFLGVAEEPFSDPKKYADFTISPLSCAPVFFN